MEQQIEKLATVLFVKKSTKEVSTIATEIARKTKKKVGSGQGGYYDYCIKIAGMLLTKNYGPELLKKYELA